MKFGLTPLAASIAAAVVLGRPSRSLTSIQPIDVVVCQSSQLLWNGGQPPYNVSIAIDTGGVLSFPLTNETALTWFVRYPAGTSIHFKVRDSAGDTTESWFSIKNGSDTSCLYTTSSTSSSGSNPTPSLSTPLPVTTTSKTSTSSTTASSSHMTPTDAVIHAGAGAAILILIFLLIFLLWRCRRRQLLTPGVISPFISASSEIDSSGARPVTSESRQDLPHYPSSITRSSTTDSQSANNPTRKSPASRSLRDLPLGDPPHAAIGPPVSGPPISAGQIIVHEDSGSRFRQEEAVIEFPPLYSSD